MTTSTEKRSLAAALDFLTKLDAAKIWHRLEHVRDSLMVYLAIPGERWEVEFFDDGHVEVERFQSDGKIAGADVLEPMIESMRD